MYLLTAASQAPIVIGALFGLGIAWPAAIPVVIAALTVIGLGGRLRLITDDRPLSAVGRGLERMYYAHWGGSLAALPLFIAASPALLFWADLDAARLAASAYAAGLTASVWAIAVRSHRVVLREHEIRVPDLPPELDGYRVAQLSDIHVGSLNPPERARAWIRAANALGVDLVALTGDYITTGTRFHEVTARLLGELTARDGVVAVLGNHDNYGDREPFVTTLRETGVRLLLNEHVVLSRGAARLVVVGVDDFYTRRTDVERSFASVPEGHPVLALVHDPRTFPAIARRGAFLVLSGHTHWGQIGLPFAPLRANLARPFFGFPGGMYRDGASTLYVSAGLGTTGAPFRLGVAPEIAIFTLRRA